MITKTIQFIFEDYDFATPKMPTCFDFSGSHGRGVNKCEVKDETHRNYSSVKLECMQCIIKHTSIVTQRDCSKDFECATLIFDNDIVFERFFRRHRDNIPHLFPTERKILPYPILDITVINYNITKITYDYISSTVNMHAPSVTISITFKNHSQGLGPLTVEPGVYPIKFRLLTINVQCDNNSLATYVAFTETPNPGVLLTGSSCPQIQSTRQVSSYKYYHFD
jgi:hypothetical protein